MSETTTSEIGQPHSGWLNSLKSFKQELNALRDRLTEIGGRNNSREVALELERYENRLRVQQDNIKRLRHDISNHAEAPAGPDLSDRFSQEFSHEERAVSELRSDFNRLNAQLSN